MAPGENGWVFDPADVAALADKLARIAACVPLALAPLGAASRRRIVAWSPQNFAHQLERALDVALGGPVPRAGRSDRWLLRLLISRANAAATHLLPGLHSRP